MARIPERRREPKKREYTYAVDENTPLFKYERVFIDEYIVCGNVAQACKIARSRCHMLPLNSVIAYAGAGNKLLAKPNVQKEVKRLMEEMEKQNIMTSKDVMGFFSQVVRGEVKDQFGLDPMLSDRIKAAQEIAKRTIDIELKAKEPQDKSITIKLDWNREQEEDEVEE